MGNALGSATPHFGAANPIIEPYLIDEPFDQWLERFETLLDINQIKDDKVKVTYLIACIGKSGYALLQDLSLPVAPKEKTFSDLAKLMLDNSKNILPTSIFKRSDGLDPGTAMACSYFFGYLKIVLPASGLNERQGNVIIRNNDWKLIETIVMKIQELLEQWRNMKLKKRWKYL